MESRNGGRRKVMRCLDLRPLRLNSSTNPPVPITRDMFPGLNCDPADPHCYKAAGDYTFLTTLDTLGPNYTLREPRKTFRFSVSTTF